MYGSTGILQRRFADNNTETNEDNEDDTEPVSFLRRQQQQQQQQRSVASSSQSTPRTNVANNNDDAESTSSELDFDKEKVIEQPQPPPVGIARPVPTAVSAVRDFEQILRDAGLGPIPKTKKRDRSASPSPSLRRGGGNGGGRGGKGRSYEEKEEEPEVAAAEEDEFSHVPLAFVLHVETLAKEIAGNLSRKIGTVVTASFARYLLRNRVKLRAFELANSKTNGYQLPPYDTDVNVVTNHELALTTLKYMLQEGPLTTITSCLSDLRRLHYSRASLLRFCDLMSDSTHRTMFARWVARLMELNDMLSGRTWRKDMLIIANNQDTAICMQYFANLR